MLKCSTWRISNIHQLHNRIFNKNNSFQIVRVFKWVLDRPELNIEILLICSKLEKKLNLNIHHLSPGEYLCLAGVKWVKTIVQ